MRIPKLIAGQGNALLTVLKPGYAEGSKPKGFRKAAPFQGRTVLRKQEFKTEVSK